MTAHGTVFITELTLPDFLPQRPAHTRPSTISTSSPPPPDEGMRGCPPRPPFPRYTPAHPLTHPHPDHAARHALVPLSAPLEGPSWAQPPARAHLPPPAPPALPPGPAAERSQLAPAHVRGAPMVTPPRRGFPGLQQDAATYLPVTCCSDDPSNMHMCMHMSGSRRSPRRTSCSQGRLALGGDTYSQRRLAANGQHTQYY